MPITAQSRLVSFVGAASLAAAQAVLDAGVAAAILAGFIPEVIAPIAAVPTSSAGAAGRVDGIALQGRSAPLWRNVTAAACVLLKVNGRASSAAIETAIAAEIAAQDLAGVTPTLRQVAFFSLALADGRVDAMALLFSDGTSSGMSAADKAKLDGLQKQGATTAIPALDIDWSLSGTYSKTLAAGANAFTFSNNADGMLIIVKVTGAGSTLTWPAAVKWTGGGADPVQTAAGTDIYTLMQVGADIIGSVLPNVG